MKENKKRKNYFSNEGTDKKKKKRLALENGMRGFLCTCNFRERDCIREAYNLLNEYSDKICESQKKQLETLDIEGKVELVENELTVNKNVEEKDYNIKQITEDISVALNKEIDELKAEAVKPLSQKRFQVIDTGVKNVIFIKSMIPDTLELLTAIIEDLQKTKKQKTRYLLRMLPIQIVCKAYLDDIKPKVEVLFEQYFTQEPKTFCIVFNRRSNSNLHRNEVIDDLAQIISKKNPGNRTNLKNPDIAVVIEVIRAVCLISIAPLYFTYKKYNLLEICNQKIKI
ncbi:PREDICTED: THUMP domain-containing protein 1 [Ceratosolen solmsi marchali]|uniref:THUMP domain-containing protein 1 n=1 Tax=Ceratosolen solmsi marchali TaxID=326594 RepID=A0AAJ7DT69_9HYME|nr:PREDICTED: THUMP domain-containing protein 1 [Ceratosolen solmsi marchali]